MGRPLKIAKTNAAASPDGVTDQGFPNDGTTDNGYTTSAVGVVGGVRAVALYGGVCIEQSWYGTYYASTGSAVVSSQNAGTLNDNELESDSLIYYNDTYVGTVSSTSSAVNMTTASTAAATDLVTVDDTTGLVVDGAVVFGANIGGLVAGTVYFVKTVPDGTTFTVSETIGGTLKSLSDDTVTTTAVQSETITLGANAAVAINGGSITVATQDNGYVLRQKGKRKYLVARSDTIQDEYIATGGTYRIQSVGDTDWAALGAGSDAAVGKIFTATADGLGLGTTGSVYAVGICTLVDSAAASLTRNEMTLTIDKDAPESDVYASTVTNKFTLDFTDNGTDENAGTKYLASFDAKTNTPDPATGLITVDFDYAC
jgi:hypothetical protein